MAKQKGKSTVDTVYDMCQPLAIEMKLDLWDIRFEKEGTSWFLRIYIDKKDGVTINDCENFSRAIDVRLDEADLIEQSYYLEVSSPGIDRELVKPEHFESYIGSIVDIRTIRPIDGVRDFTGELKSFDAAGAHVLLADGSETVFKKGETAFIRLNIDDIDIGGIDENE